MGLLVLGVLAAVIGLVPPPPSDGRRARRRSRTRASVNQVSVNDLTPGDARRPARCVRRRWLPASTRRRPGRGPVPRGPGRPGLPRVARTARPSDPVTVTSPDDHPAPSFYDGITLERGLRLHPDARRHDAERQHHLPDDGVARAVAGAVDYSGYDPSQPGGAPSEAAMFPLQGYVVVGLNMRGTACSGGAFDYFERLQTLDGYDAIEMLANQPWSNGDVGMVGISYMGISQLFVGPDPAAAPAGHHPAVGHRRHVPLDALPRRHPQQRLRARAGPRSGSTSAKPAAHQWVQDRIAGGDTTCAANQTLRLQSVDLLAEIDDNPYYEAGRRRAGARARSSTRSTCRPISAARSRTSRPAASGRRCSTTSRRRRCCGSTSPTACTPRASAPRTSCGCMEFVDFYVGQAHPAGQPAARAASAACSMACRHLRRSPIPLPPDRFAGYPTYAPALAAYQAEPPDPGACGRTAPGTTPASR